MNVTCPGCATVFRVDPAKVPERGVRARCSVCGGLIAVRRPDLAAPATPPTAAAVPAPEVTPAPPEPPPVAAASVVPAPPSAPAAVATPPPPERPPLVTPDVPLSALPGSGRPEPEADAPVAPQAVPGPQGGSQAAPGRFSNPFLQQDPSTRARRLARALVSDLVVYHPEKRQRGLAEGNLKDLFAEEIRKSWEEYVEQVGEELAGTTPYFTEALNEILAEGEQLFG